MNRKLIFLDIDGTLTEAGKNVPPASAIDAIRRAQQAGHKVVLCSGRNYGMLRPLLEYHFDGIIGSAGGYIEYEDKVIYNCPMTPAQQEKVLTCLAENGVFRTIEGKMGSFVDESFKEFLHTRVSEGANSELLRWREQLESSLNIRPMKEYDGEAIYKVVFACPSIDNLKVPQAELGDEFNFCIQDPDPFGLINGELINKQFNKGTAVRRMAEAAGIPMSDTIAFGDSMNDLEMIETAALGICMENGSETLKQHADEVCPAVDDDGLYKAFAWHNLF